MFELYEKIAQKIDEITESIEIVGKIWIQSKNPNDLNFVCRRIEARNKLELYLNNLM